MRIAVSHLRFVEFAGTETYMLTVTRHLEQLGHEAVVYTTTTGPMADFARGLGIKVVDSLAALGPRVDAVLAQDASTAYELADAYPDAPCVFVMHSLYQLQLPPQLPGTCQVVIAMNDRLEQRARSLAHDIPVVRLRQPIDLWRYGARRPSVPPPRRVLLLSNVLKETRVETLRLACRRAGLELVRTGISGGVEAITARPERAIAECDIVVSMGRGALESMACSRPVYVLGPVGSDGWVTHDSYPALEADGFTGQATGRELSVERIAADLSEWNRDMGDINRDIAARHHSAQAHAVQLATLLSETAIDARPTFAVGSELARLVRDEWHQFVRTIELAGHNSELLSRLARLEPELAASHDRLTQIEPELAASNARLAQIEPELAATRATLAQIEPELAASQAALADVTRARDALAEELNAMRATRRYRLACRLAEPLDRLRAGRARVAVQPSCSPAESEL
jgi:hypothetical protein